MRTLTLSTGSFDQDNTFSLDIGRVFRGRPLVLTVTLQRDYAVKGDGIYWLMQRAGCIKAQYTDKDREERARLNADSGVKNGEIVLIDGEEYRVKVLGDYSNAAVLEKVA